MKKSLVLSAVCLLFCVLSACVEAPTMDLSGYLQQRKQIGMPLDIAELYRSGGDEEVSYYIPMGNFLSIRLFCLATGEIYECRVLLRKMNPDGSENPTDALLHSAFLEECRTQMRAFGLFSEADCESVLQALSLNDKTIHNSYGSQTTPVGHFTVQLSSHPLETAFVIRNEWLKETETTVLPESVPLFDDTTVTRKETVPHR